MHIGIQDQFSYFIRLHDINRAAAAALKKWTEQMPPHFEYAQSSTSRLQGRGRCTKLKISQQESAFFFKWPMGRKKDGVCFS